MTRARWRRPRQSSLVTVVLHLKAVVLQGWVRGLVVVSEPATEEGQFLVPLITVLDLFFVSANTRIVYTAA